MTRNEFFFIIFNLIILNKACPDPNEVSRVQVLTQTIIGWKGYVIKLEHLKKSVWISKLRKCLPN